MARCVLNPLRWYECRIACEGVTNAARLWNVVVGGDPKIEEKQLTLCSSMYCRFQQAVKKKKKKKTLYSILLRANAMRMARTNGGSENSMIYEQSVVNAEQSNCPLLLAAKC